MENHKEIEERLAEPFSIDEIKFRPGATNGNRALALPYVDARLVQDRLDEVLGVMGWQDDYDVLPDGSVVCRLTLHVGDKEITKVDVGGPSEQPDEGDRRKAAFSDALKRAAVKFGVGRYLYQIGPIWADFDPQKKRFTNKPSLPASALPKKPGQKPAPAKQADKTLPANGEELYKRLAAYEARLVQAGVCNVGALMNHVRMAGVRAGHSEKWEEWNAQAIALAVEQTKVFEAEARKPKPQKPQQQPASAPDPVEEREAGGPDPAEQITPAEVRDIQRLLKEAKVTWPNALTRLNRDGAELPGNTTPEDLSFHWYRKLAKALRDRAADLQKQQPAKAG